MDNVIFPLTDHFIMISDKTHPHPEPYEEPTYTKKWKGNAHVLRNPCNTEDIPYYAEASDNNTAYYIYADIPNGKCQDDDHIDITIYPKFTAQYKVRNQSNLLIFSTIKDCLD